MKPCSWAALCCLAAIAAGCGRREEPKAAPVKVKVVRVESVGISDGRTFSGTIEAESTVALSFPSGGTIGRMLVDEGQTVTKGQLVAVTDEANASSSVAMAEAAMSQALDMLAQAQDAHGRMKLLHDNGSLPEIKWIEAQTQLSQAEAGVRQARAAERMARKGLADTRLHAPVAGYVAERMAEPGQNVLPGAPVVKVTDIRRVKVKIAVPDTEIGRFERGQKVRVTVAALGGFTCEAVVTEKSVTADPLSRSYEVKSLADNAEGRLLPGMICEVTADGGALGRTGMVLPANLVQMDDGNHPFVWKIAGGRAVKAYVATGYCFGRSVVVTAGLHVGDSVVSEGWQKVSEGTSVTIIK